MNWDWVWHGNNYGLIDFEFYVLGKRDDYFFVMFDRFWVLLLDMLMDGVNVGLQVMATIVATAIVANGAASKVVGTSTMAAEIERTTGKVTGLELWKKEKQNVKLCGAN